MIPRGAMPHPWWMLWQIGDFLVMATLIGLFVRYVLRSNRSSDAEETPLPGPADGGDAEEDASAAKR